MADQAHDSGDSEDTRTPRWVRTFKIIGGVVVVLGVIMLVTGHGPWRHLPKGDPTASNVVDGVGGSATKPPGDN